ncbi:MAG: fibrobacter succinogenes major paralogous domain-containing protein [Patescibacteria group bacterium]|nr:fibrobacter succinogenes major paralogous domain-containing protein [Patescibacteria group bacterium]
MIYNINHKKSKGFTLVEILVAISILSIIILAINRIYFAIMDSQKDIIGENFVQSDLEYFTRLISNNIKDAQRGDGVLCSVPEDKFFILNATSSSITFIKDDECLEFYLSDDDGVGRIKMNDSISATDQYITSSKTDVLGLVFEVEDNIETGQPLVTILTKGAPISDSSNFIYIQNSVSVIENVIEVQVGWSCGDDIYDSECNAYGTLEIGTQCWMAENLNVGTRINGVNDQTDNSIIEKYCYDDLVSNCNIYGGLYQWNEAMQYSGVEGSQGLCPSGWHIPTDAEFVTLTNFLGGLSVAGGKMKETGTSHWTSPNTGATNESNFTALPGGSRTSSFAQIGSNGSFWTSLAGGNGAYYYYLFNGFAMAVRDSTGTSVSISVRCLKD